MATLSRSNPHLSTPAKRAQAAWVTIATSSAIEGIHAPFKTAKRGNKSPDLTPRPRAKPA